PITRTYLVRDLIRDTGLRDVIVARPALGTINHTVLTVNELKRAGVVIAGIVINRASEARSGIAERTSAAVIKEITGVPILCEVPYMKRPDGSQADAAAAELYAMLKGLLSA
ncbi:MAG TPA: AAA family ATPase, partial [bacterium]|nr:AAA family ATPase [bacterium]